MNKVRDTISLIMLLIIISLVSITVVIARDNSKQKAELEKTKQQLAEYKADELEIYPCPFCGSNNVRVEDVFGKGTDCYVRCDDCYSSGPAKNPNTGRWDMTKNEAIELWNSLYEKKGN